MLLDSEILNIFWFKLIWLIVLMFEIVVIVCGIKMYK